MHLSDMDRNEADLADVDSGKLVVEVSEPERFLAGQYEIIEYSDVFNHGLGKNSRELSETGLPSNSVHESNSNIRKFGTNQLSCIDRNPGKKTNKKVGSDQDVLEKEDDELTQVKPEVGMSISRNQQDLEGRCKSCRENLDTQGEIKTFSRHAQEQIQNLIDYQEKLAKNYEDLEGRSKCVQNDLEKERQSKQLAEQKLRSKIEELTKIIRDENSRTQKLMLKAADPYRRDDEYFKLKIEALQYQIKNWCQRQELELSHPPQFGIKGFVCSKLGQQKNGPNYEFLKRISIDWAGYTCSGQGLKMILQAYIWKVLVELIFENDRWASEFPVSYGSLKTRLQPGAHYSKEYTEGFQFWRSTTARLLTERISASRISVTVSTIREAVVRPIIDGAKPNVPNLDLEKLGSIVEDAMKLDTDMAQQRARFGFEFVPLEDYGRTFAIPGIMYSCQGGFIEAGHAKVVQLTLAPRVMRWGSQEGTCFEACKQIVMMEIESKAVQSAPVTNIKPQRLSQL